MAEEQQEQEQEQGSGADTDDSDGNSAQESAQREEEEVEQAKQTMAELEEKGPPDRLEDWPGGKAKYQTFGGPEGEAGYDEAATEQLGPSSLRHHEDGSVTIEGEEVDNPDEYKSDPIPGGPSDPDAPPDPAMVGEEEDDMDESGDSDDSGESGDSGDSGDSEERERD